MYTNGFANGFLTLSNGFIEWLMPEQVMKYSELLT